MRTGTWRTALRGSVLLVVVSALLFGGGAAAQERFPGAEWDHVNPAKDHWSGDGLALARSWSRKIKSTAVLVIHHGAVVVDWGDTAKRVELHSVRKSLLSALIGIAVAQGKISLDSTLAQLGIDDNPPSLTEAEKQATVRMLLEARSGVYHPALYETPGMAAKRPARGSHPPGTFWYYNNWDFDALGTIFEHATGTGIYDALDAQIAKPIGMQDYRPQDGHYVTGAASIHRAYPVRMSARDLARFALLYLHDGAWAGRQVVPADWVRESTRSYSDAGSARGYGYLWWTAAPGNELPEGSFCALGDGGQAACIIPADDLVIVHLEETPPGTSLRNVFRLLRYMLLAGGYRPGR